MATTLTPPSTTANVPGHAKKSPGFFSKYKRELGLIVGVLVFLAIYFMPAQAGLPRQGQQCLALSLMTVVFWATGVAHPGYTSVLLLCGWVWTKTADAYNQCLCEWDSYYCACYAI